MSCTRVPEHVSVINYQAGEYNTGSCGGGWDCANVSSRKEREMRQRELPRSELKWQLSNQRIETTRYVVAA